MSRCGVRCGQLGVRDVALKWPNDVLRAGAKLGGVLIEMRAESGGPVYLVIGVGLNVRLPRAAGAAIQATGLRATSLADVPELALPRRSVLAATLIARLVEAIDEFGARGFGAFRDEWQAADALAGRPSRVTFGNEVIDGTARGVDVDGALLLETGGRLRALFVR